MADPAFHPLDQFNTLERATEWVRIHEPQVHELMAPHMGSVQDFLTLKHFSYGATQVYSGQRWALTGEAGVFLDPFYSPGSDFIAMSNGFITAMVKADREGADVDALARAYDRQYLAMYRSFLLLYQGQYEIFGNAQVMALKVVWDYTGYWGSTALLYFQDKLHDVAFMKSVTIDVVQVFRLNQAVQKFLLQWHRLDPGQWAEPKMINYHVLDYLAQWQALLRHRYDDDRLRRTLRENRRIMEQVVKWLYQRATGTDREIDPYRISIEASDVVAPVQRLDMLEELSAWVNARTEFRDGIRTLVDGGETKATA